MKITTFFHGKNKRQNCEFINFTQQSADLLPKLPFCYPTAHRRVPLLEPNVQTYKPARNRRQRWLKTALLQRCKTFTWRLPCNYLSTFLWERSNFIDKIIFFLLNFDGDFSWEMLNIIFKKVLLLVHFNKSTHFQSNPSYQLRKTILIGCYFESEHVTEILTSTVVSQ